MYTILLADDHPLILRGLSDLFSPTVDLRVIGAESNGRHVTDAVQQFRPDILILDLMMPGANGMETIRQVAKTSQRTRIVVLSIHEDIAYVWEALHCGALAYVFKRCDSGEVVVAARHAGARRRYLCTLISESALQDFALKVTHRGADPYELLTQRERQVFHLVAEGYTSAQIAAQLHIGIRTVETYRANMLLKLNLRNHTELIRYAIRRGSLSPL